MLDDDATRPADQAILTNDKGGAETAPDTAPKAATIANRTLLVIGGAVAGVVAVLVLGVMLLGGPSPVEQLGVAVTAVAAREVPRTLADPGSVAARLGITGSPADVTFTVTAWKDATPDDQGKGPKVAAGTFTLTAARGVTTLASADFTVAATLVEKPAQGAPSLLPLDVEGDPIPLSALVPDFSSYEAADAAAQAATASVADLDPLEVSILPADADDPSVAIPPDVEQPDPNELVGFHEMVSGAVPAVRTSWTWSTPYGEAPAGSSITAQPVAAVYRVGTIDPATITGPAGEALAALRAAVSSGDLAAAKAVLVNAQGVSLGGLRAASLGDAASLTAAKDGNRFVAQTPAGTTIAPDSVGTWKVDYAGQPLGPLETAGKVYTEGKDDYGSAPLTITLASVDPKAGGPFAPELAVQIDDHGRMPWNDEIQFTALYINGERIPVDTPVTACRVSGTSSMTCPWPSDALPVNFPDEGLSSVVAGVRLLSWYNQSLYTAGQIALAAPGSDVWRSTGAISKAFGPSDYYVARVTPGLVVVAPGQTSLSIPMTLQHLPYNLSDTNLKIRYSAIVNGEALPTRTLDPATQLEGGTNLAVEAPLKVPEGGLTSLAVKVEFVDGRKVLAAHTFTFER